MKKRFADCLASILALFFVLFCAEGAHATMTFATGSPGGNYYPVGEQIAKILGADEEKIRVEIRETHGSVDNIRRLCRGEDELAIVQSDILYRNLTGERNDCKVDGKGGAEFHEIRGIAALFGEYVQVIVRKDSRIKHLIDLTGYKVSVGHKESGTFRNAIELLGAAGLELEDILPVTEYGPSESVNKVISGEIDAAILTSGSLVVNEGDNQNKIRLVSIRKTVLDELVEKHPYYGHKQVEILDSPYQPRLPYVRAILVARNVVDDQAYKITKALYDGWKALLQVNANKPVYIEFLSDKSIARKLSVPIHPGAEKFYIEKELIYSNKNYYILFLVFLSVGMIALSRKLLGGKVQMMVASSRALEKALGVIDTVTSKKWAFIAWGIAFVFSAEIILIKTIEANYSFYHDVPTPFENLSFTETLLWLLIYASTGVTQGIFPVSIWGKIASIIIPLLGIGGILYGILTFANQRSQNRDLERRGLKPRFLKDHIILCGWNERAPGLIRELTSRKHKVMVLAEMDEEYPLREYKFDPDVVSYCKGYSSSHEYLRMAHLKHANKVLVMAGQKKLASENARGVLTALAAKALYNKLRPGESIPVYAELLFEKNEAYFRSAGVDELVPLDLIRNRFTASSCLNNGISQLLLGLFSHSEEKNSLYSVRVRDMDPKIQEGVSRKPFKEILLFLRKREALLLAILRHTESKGRAIEQEFRDDSPYIIRPTTKEERKYQVDRNDTLIYIAKKKAIN